MPRKGSSKAPSRQTSHHREEFRMSESHRPHHSPSRKRSSRRSHHHESVKEMEQPKKCCNWSCCCKAFIATFVIVGVILAVVGIVLVLKHRQIMVEQIKKIAPLVSGSSTLKLFMSPPNAMKANIYMFSVTNPEAVVERGEKPDLQEIGPFVYQYQANRYDFSFNKDETDLSFQRKQTYIFDKEASGDRTEDDEITQLDLVAYVGLVGAREMGMGSLAMSFLRQYNRTYPFRKFKVGELLWGGNDPLYSFLMKSLSVVTGDKVEAGKNDKFGLFYGVNGTANTFVIDTGKANMEMFQKVLKYGENEGRFDDIWPIITDNLGRPMDVNNFRGVLGSSFAPDVNRNEILTALVPTMCFALDLSFSSAVDIDDMEMLRFGIDYKSFNPLSLKINQAFCDPHDRNNKTKCLSSGVLNSTQCLDDKPVVFSWPHFLEADPYYLELVSGLKPENDRHATYLDVDPLTGISVRAGERFQINFVLERMNVGRYSKLPQFTVFPVMWMDMTAEIDADGKAQLKKAIYNIYNLLRTLGYACLIASVILVPVAVIVFFIYRCRFM